MRLSEDGKFVYVVSGATDSVAFFERDAVSVELQFVQQIRGREGLESPTAVVEGNDGTLYVASGKAIRGNGGGLVAFTRIAATDVSRTALATVTQSSTVENDGPELALDRDSSTAGADAC